jgi:hypothetical protein
MGTRFCAQFRQVPRPPNKVRRSARYIGTRMGAPFCTSYPWCGHSAPMAIAPLIIRSGGNTSSDRLRRCARCTVCGHKGATLQHPGWIENGVGWQPFPVREMTT